MSAWSRRHKMVLGSMLVALMVIIAALPAVILIRRDGDAESRLSSDSASCVAEAIATATGRADAVQPTRFPPTDIKSVRTARAEVAGTAAVSYRTSLAIDIEQNCRPSP